MSLPYWRCAGIFFIPCIPKKIKQLSLPQKLLLRGYKLQWLGDRTVNFFFCSSVLAAKLGRGQEGVVSPGDALGMPQSLEGLLGKEGRIREEE